MSERMLAILYKGKKGSTCFGCKADGRKRYVWIVTDRETIRDLLALKKRQTKEVPWEECHMEGEKLILEFPYEKSRRLTEFFPAGKEPDEIQMEMLAFCMSCDLPWSFLLLVLESKAVNIRQDGLLYISYDLDYDMLRFDAGEADCVQACGKWLCEIQGSKRRWGRKQLTKEQLSRGILLGRKLAEKKLNRGLYKTFLELYQDLYGRDIPGHTRRLRLPWDDRVFYSLFGIGLILSVIALITVTIFLGTGDIPLFRLFQEPIREIGTILFE